MKKVLLVLLTLACPASNALAWGFKGHSIANEAATHAVPYELPEHHPQYFQLYIV